MSTLRNSLSLMQFEFRRGWTLGRMTAFWVLALFPPAIVLLVTLTIRAIPQFLPIVFFLNFISCILALLLWATPNVYAELENRNWIFVTSRPGGRVSLVVGKWLTAVIAAFLVCLVSTTLCWLAIIIRADMLDREGLATVGRIWLQSLWIWALACVNYAALFSLIGVLFQRRAMVIATIYTLLNECVMAFVFALISKFSVRYHLVGVSYYLFDWYFPGARPDEEFLEMTILGLPLWANYAALVLIPAVTLCIASYVIRYRQYVTIDEV